MVQKWVKKGSSSSNSTEEQEREVNELCLQNHNPSTYCRKCSKKVLRGTGAESKVLDFWSNTRYDLQDRFTDIAYIRSFQLNSLGNRFPGTWVVEFIEPKMKWHDWQRIMSLVKAHGEIMVLIEPENFGAQRWSSWFCFFMNTHCPRHNLLERWQFIATLQATLLECIKHHLIFSFKILHKQSWIEWEPPKRIKSYYPSFVHMPGGLRHTTWIPDERLICQKIKSSYTSHFFHPNHATLDDSPFQCGFCFQYLPAA